MARRSESVKGSSRKAVARGVYSILARARSTPSAMMRAWSKASVGASAPLSSRTGQKRARATSGAAWGAGGGGGGGPVRAQLLQVHAFGQVLDPGLLFELADGSLLEVLVSHDESARQGP